MTEDGWELTLFHITGKVDKEESASFGKYSIPVLFQHDSFSDAEAHLKSADVGEPWILQLAKYGYDIWLGNNRGTKYSNRSFNDPQEDKDRWAFTMHEMAIYDLKAEFKTIE